MFDILGIQSPGYSFNGSCPSYSLQANNLGSRIRVYPVLCHILVTLANNLDSRIILINNLDSRIRDDPVLRAVLITSTLFHTPLANHFGSRIREDPVLRVVLIACLIVGKNLLKLSSSLLIW